MYRHVLSRSRSQDMNAYEAERTVLQTELQAIQFHAAQKIQLQQEYNAAKRAKEITLRQFKIVIKANWKRYS